MAVANWNCNYETPLINCLHMQQCSHLCFLPAVALVVSFYVVDSKEKVMIITILMNILLP